MYQSFKPLLKTVYLKFRQKYSAVRLSFNNLLDIWKCGEIRPLAFLWKYKMSQIPPNRPKYWWRYILYVFSLACYSTKVNMYKSPDSFGGLTCEFRKASFCDLKSTKVSQIQERWTKLLSVSWQIIAVLLQHVHPHPHVWKTYTSSFELASNLLCLDEQTPSWRFNSSMERK